MTGSPDDPRRPSPPGGSDGPPPSGPPGGFGLDLPPGIDPEQVGGNLGQKQDNMALASLVLGVVVLVLACLGTFLCCAGPVILAGAGTGLTLGIVSLTQQDKIRARRSRGMAWTGVVLNALALLVMFGVWIAFFVLTAYSP